MRHRYGNSICDRRREMSHAQLVDRSADFNSLTTTSAY
jgi:hypothetical protein